MDNKIMFITNNTNLQDKCHTICDIEYSIHLGKDSFNQYDYIIIDYDTFLLEDNTIEHIEKYEEKILFINNSPSNKYKSIPLEELCLENIKIYFNDYNLETTEYENIDQDSSIVNDLIDLYLQDKDNIEKLLEELNKTSYKLRKRFYNVIDQLSVFNKLNELKIYNKIKIEYLIYKFKKRIN